METSSDLVNYFRLEYRNFSGYVEHTRIYSDPARGIRKAKKTTQWTRVKEIGQGGFGDVWLEREHGGELRAVKEVRKYDEMSRKIDYERELLAMAYFSRDSSTYVSFLGWFETTSKVYIAMEYLSLGSLQHCVSTSLAESETKVIVTQILEGLKTMHDQNFSHRDLKPLNIFVVSKSPNWWVKIGDFGISKRVKEGLTMLRTSMSGDYVAPEVMRLLGDDEEIFSYSNAVDMWSLGCIVSWLLTTSVPFPNGRGLLKYCQGQKPFPSGVLESIGYEAIDFVRKMMAIEPSNRLSAEQSLQHTWLEPPSEVPALHDQFHIHGSGHNNLQSTQIQESQETSRIQPVGQAPYRASSQYKQPEASMKLPERSRRATEIPTQYPIPYPYYSPTKHKSLEASTTLPEYSRPALQGNTQYRKPHADLSLSRYKGGVASVTLPERYRRAPETKSIEDKSPALTSQKSKVTPTGSGEFIGLRISLITNRDMRYCGTLEEIDSESSTVALTGVVSFGTEDRWSGETVPPSAIVYDHIRFRGLDIKDLRIEKAAEDSGKPLLPRKQEVEAKVTLPPRLSSTVHREQLPDRKEVAAKAIAENLLATIPKKQEQPQTGPPRLPDLVQFSRDFQLTNPVLNDWGHVRSPVSEIRALNKANEGAKRTQPLTPSSARQTTNPSPKSRLLDPPASDPFQEEIIKAIEAAQRAEAEAEARYQENKHIRLQEAERKAEVDEELRMGITDEGKHEPDGLGASAFVAAERPPSSP